MMKMSLQGIRKHAVAISKLAILAFSSAGAMTSALALPPILSQQTVQTEQGKVSGIVNVQYRAFLGIPYAAAPVGPLRWQAPQPRPHWGWREATSFASRCPQTDNNMITTLDEDCLALNVYTPRVGKKLPVMVYIHGGSFNTGAGSDYNPILLTQKAKAIIVTINYRLGALGFLAYPGLSAELPDKASGQYALQDQQFALQWVKKNIKNFGGDPDNVTVFGESAGGISICAQLASPSAAGLFHKALMESGPCTADPIPLKRAEINGVQFARKFNCDNTACLRALSVADILQQPPIESSGGGKMWSPAYGGVNSTLTMTPMTAFKEGKFNRVPVLNGSNRDEYRLFIGFQENAQGYALTADQYTQYAKGLSPTNSDKIIAQYPLSNYPAPDIATSAMYGDALFSCGAFGADQLLQQHNVPVYAYEFNEEKAPPPLTDPYMPMLATHSAELPFIFRSSSIPLVGKQALLSDQMMRYWGNFAATGNPNGPGLPVWPLYTVANGKVQSLKAESITTTETFGTEHKCGFWASMGF